jgi:hypothetical protein
VALVHLGIHHETGLVDRSSLFGKASDAYFLVVVVGELDARGAKLQQ